MAREWPPIFEIERVGKTLKLEGTVIKGFTEVKQLLIEDLLDSNPKKTLRKAWLKAL